MFDDLSPALARVLPPCVVWHTVTIGEAVEPLFPEEAAAVAKAVVHRQAEFAAGRQAARSALRRLCGYSGPVPPGDDRAPVWPPGLVGSITHDEGLAVAAVALASDVRALGLDVDTVARFRPELEGPICTPDEVERLLQGRTPSERQRQLARVFCIKEAVYKAQYPLTRGWLDFADLVLDWPQEAPDRFVATLQRRVGGFEAGYRFEGHCVVEGPRCVAALVLQPIRGDRFRG
ncbi:MAG: 4'-phosphopantetheinyl transferase superfamily protein [Hydrogenophaga sp.]